MLIYYKTSSDLRGIVVLYSRSYQNIGILFTRIWTKNLNPHVTWIRRRVSWFPEHHVQFFSLISTKQNQITSLSSWALWLLSYNKRKVKTLFLSPFITVTKLGWSCFPSPWGTIVWVIQEATHFNSIRHEPKIYFVSILLPSEQNVAIQSFCG